MKKQRKSYIGLIGFILSLLLMGIAVYNNLVSFSSSFFSILFSMSFIGFFPVFLTTLIICIIGIKKKSYSKLAWAGLIIATIITLVQLIIFLKIISEALNSYPFS